MNSSAVLHALRWLVRDTVRQAHASGILGVVVGVTTVCVAFCLTASVVSGEAPELTLALGAVRVPLVGGVEQGVRTIQAVLAVCVAGTAWQVTRSFEPDRETITNPAEDLSHADVTRALQQVGLIDELLELPEGLDTVLHPHGRPLSYRQACRLMIARAIAGRPRLIVLDGALDQIDQQDEQELAEMLFATEAPWTVICFFF